MSDAMSEQETCRTFVVPELRVAGWDKRQIREQYRITNGKIIVSPRRHRPGNPLVADYVLEYRVVTMCRWPWSRPSAPR
jgi:type I restriction enzyme, R subunit